MFFLQDGSSRILHKDTIYIVNVAVGSVLACQLLRSLIWLSYLVVRTWQMKRVWKRRRARNVAFFFVEISSQLVRDPHAGSALVTPCRAFRLLLVNFGQSLLFAIASATVF